MAHVTPIVSAAQVEYRVADGHGCGPEDQRSVDYRVQGMGGAQLWIGEGLAEVGLTNGQAFGAADVEAARALMNGVHPDTGEQLVEPVLRLAEEAKLPAVPLVDAVIASAAEAGAQGSARGAAEWSRLLAGTQRLGDGYRVDVRILEKVAARAGVDLEAVYGKPAIEEARTSAAKERVDVRTKGYDLTLTLPKSFSVAWALAPEGERQAVADAYTQAALDTVKTAEGWHARATRGHHGDGTKAEVVSTSGLLGWLSVDPVNRNGDAHWHAHVTVAAMGRAGDGKWSALASSGTDSLFSSVGALGGLMEARARALCSERFGWEFRESQITGRLEVAHVPDGAIRVTSTRRADVVKAMLAAGLDPESVTREEDDAAGAAARKTKVEGAERMPNVVERTRSQVSAEGVDPTLPRPGKPLSLAELRPAESQRRHVDGLVPGTWEAAVADARRVVLDEGAGPTAHAQSFSWRQAIGLIAAAVPAAADLGQCEMLLAAALDTPAVVRLPERADRAPAFTTTKVLAAERAVLTAALESRRGGGVVVRESHLAAAVAAFEADKGYSPNAEQLRAVRQVVFGGGRFDVLAGLPGTGKTTVMRLVGDAYAHAGYTVRGLSTAAIAAEGLASDAGFPARTLAAHLLGAEAVTGPAPEWGSGRDAAGDVGRGAGRVDVYVVDEAGMVDTRAMAQLLAEASASGAKVVAVGDDRQLPAVGIGGWFAPAREATHGGELVDVRRQQHEHELAALRAYRAGEIEEAFAGYTANGQIVVTGTRDGALVAAAAIWHTHAQAYETPLEKVNEVALLAGRREDTQVLNALLRVQAREAGQLVGEDVTYKLMGGGELHLAVGEVVVLRKNESVGPVQMRNGRRAVVEAIDDDRTLTVAWQSPDGTVQRAALTPGDVVAGQVASSYLEADHVQGAAAGTVHVSQGRTSDYAVAVIDPRANAATYVALSRDRRATTIVLSAEAVAATPEELAGWQRLPAVERDAAVTAAYAAALREAGSREAADRELLIRTWPELAGPRPRAVEALPEPPTAPAEVERDARAVTQVRPLTRSLTGEQLRERVRQAREDSLAAIARADAATAPGDDYDEPAVPDVVEKPAPRRPLFRERDRDRGPRGDGIER